MSLLEAIGNVVGRKALADEQIINAAAIRDARGENLPDAEIETLAGALQRLGKGQSDIAMKVEIIRRHNEAAEQEREHEVKAAEARKVQAQYDAIAAELEPINRRLAAVGDRLVPLLGAVQAGAGIVGQAAALRRDFPELFPGD